jgi:hypothetical protein
VIGAVALALAGDALACTCAPVDLVRDLPRSDAAFVGSVLERRSTHASVLLLFRVEQVYKGDISGRVEVETERDGSTCGLDLEVGERVGLLLEREGGLWRSNLCSRVEPAAFLALTDVEDNELPDLNWPGVALGLLFLLVGLYALLRKTRRYRDRTSR